MTQDDKDLLILAAKAAGMSVGTKNGWIYCENLGPHKLWGLWAESGFPTEAYPNPRYLPRRWNPILSNDDAFKLMIALGISLPTRLGDQCYANVNGETYKEVGTDPEAATRRVIVKAAAYIGKAM